MMTDLSFLDGNSVTDLIPDSEATVKFTSVDDAIVLIMKCSHGALMAKFNIKSVYRILPIQTSDHFFIWHEMEKKYFH